MHVGWICVKHGFANSAPRLCARHAAVTLLALALVERKKTLPYPPVASTTACAEYERTAPVMRSRVTMPTARPSFTTRSSISVRVVQLDGAEVHLAGERLVRAEEQLLAGLAAGVERARHLRATERAVVEQAAVLAGERHALRDALVDDVHAQLREPVHVRLTGAVVAALHRVVEEAVDAVAVVRGSSSPR